jgi:hypothetical protein
MIRILLADTSLGTLALTASTRNLSIVETFIMVEPIRAETAEPAETT